jgi:hypothetical protein
MNKWIIVIICLSFVLGCVPSGTYLKQDRWDSDRMNIKSGTYKTEGYIKPDRWESERLNIYDKYGKSTGVYIKKDRWQPDRYNIKGKRTPYPQ